MELNTFLVLALGVGLGFYVQTLVGFAASIVAFPIMLQVIGIAEATALTSVFFFAFSAMLIWKNWQLIDKRTVLEMAVGSIFGLFLGIYLLKFADPTLLKKAFGVFVLLFALYSLVRERKIKLFRGAGPVLGFLGGILSGLFSSGGSLFILYIYSKISQPRVVRATIIGTLGITNFLRVPILVYSGLLTYEIFLKALCLVPVLLLSLYLGQKTLNRINESLLKKILLVVLVVSGVMLIVK